MSSGGEIITLALGSYSASVATHAFNLEDEATCYDVPKNADTGAVAKYNELQRSILFQSKETAKGRQTTTPRFIAVTPSGGSRQRADNQPDGAMLWDGKVQKVEQEQDELNTFQQQLQDGDMQADLDYLKRKRKQLSHQKLLSGDGYDDDEDEDGDDAEYGYGNQGKLKQQLQQLDETIQDLEDRLLESQQTREQPLDSKMAVDADAVDTSELTQTDVQHWTDMAKVQFHDRSIYEVPGLHVDDDLNEFSVFHEGLTLFKKEAEEDEITDRLRYFAEASDYLNGFHLLFDQDSGFAGVAGAVADHLSDYYAKTPVFGVGCVDAHADTDPHANNNGQDKPVKMDPNNVQADTSKFLRLVNSVYTLTEVAKKVSVFTTLGAGPVQHNHWLTDKYDRSSAFHTSAVLGATFQNLTAAYRQNPESGLSGHTVRSYTALLTPFPRLNILQTRLHIPFDLQNPWLLGPDNHNHRQPTPTVAGSGMLLSSARVLNPYIKHREAKNAPKAHQRLVDAVTVRGNTSLSTALATYNKRRGLTVNSAREHTQSRPDLLLQAKLLELTNHKQDLTLFNQGVALPIPYPTSILRDVPDTFQMPIATHFSSASAYHQELDVLSKTLKFRLRLNDMNRDNYSHVPLGEWEGMIDELGALSEEYRQD